HFFCCQCGTGERLPFKGIHFPYPYGKFFNFNILKTRICEYLLFILNFCGDIEGDQPEPE
ncbi:hypothetical protein, partial [Vibrio cholerae]|uniref:hypothetical protein n=1 Tax=Vibrio cholerae TaxID=666 RepID=UPI001C26D70F